ncbi:hypothetical protein RIF29_24302 [Crotalaria pallida]|uniref:F-box domain-containing protein n=1 Tax=Crotalaria pallida TaxID=3830 RepID=A0AAN9EPN2_CROPI
MDKKIKLPQELVLEILLRLPVKSLTRFKCVDWSWNDLFETTTFITMHHMQGQKKERLAIFEYEGMVSQCSSIKLISDNSQEVRDVEFHLDTPIAICPCGSYKGIFYQISGQSVYRHTITLMASHRAISMLFTIHMHTWTKSHEDIKSHE